MALSEDGFQTGTANLAKRLLKQGLSLKGENQTPEDIGQADIASAIEKCFQAIPEGDKDHFLDTIIENVAGYELLGAATSVEELVGYIGIAIEEIMEEGEKKRTALLHELKEYTGDKGTLVVRYREKRKARELLKILKDIFFKSKETKETADYTLAKFNQHSPLHITPPAGYESVYDAIIDNTSFEGLQGEIKLEEIVIALKLNEFLKIEQDF